MMEQMLKEAAARYPTKVAVVCGRERITFEGLYAQTLRFSRALQAQGVREGACVTLLLPNGIEFLVAFYAVARLGAVAAPLNPQLSEAELRSYVQGSDSHFIVTDMPHQALAQRVLEGAPTPAVRLTIDEVLQGDSALEDDDTSTSLWDDQTVLYQYSSGSMGRPKRVPRTQRNLRAEADAFASTVGITPEDTILGLVPLFHAYGFGNCVLAPVRTGATLILLEPVVQEGVAVQVPLAARTQQIIDLIDAHQVTILPAVPYIYQTLLEASFASPPPIHSLRICFSAGNFLPLETFRQFKERFGISIRQQYGNTETGAIAVDMEEPVDPARSGRPLVGVNIRILDDEGNELTDGEGEVALSSPALTAGYHNQPEVNALAFRDGYFLTGDLGRKDAEGHLYLTGRKKVFIDTGGYKVDPVEVEDVLREHPGVAEVVVVGIKGGSEGELIKAVVVRQGECQEQALLDHCRGRLAAFKVPRMIEFRAEIPRSPLGKILRKDLLEPLPEASPPTSNLWVAQAIRAARSRDQQEVLIFSFLETQLAELFTLPIDQIELDRPLGDYGLTSIHMFELGNRLQSHLGIPFVPALLWNYPTGVALGEYLLETLSTTAPSRETP